MATSKKELVKKLLKNNNIEGNEEELLEMLIDQSIAIDPDKEKLSKGDKLADKFTEIAGSWTFIIIFTICLVLWIFLNLTKIIELDAYPFILLNLVLSCLAAFQAPIIMMSQNRQSKKDSERSRNDYRTDLKSELILEELHDKMELILSNQKKILKLIDDKEDEK
ncbi:MAG: DUF1003 domain-containing protein [Bacteroidales bacterium]|nr:DUF1003 domain-containing protein [Bacteroidales bacterium]